MTTLLINIERREGHVMPGQYDNEMRGVLFKNRQKTPGDNKPEAKGECQINGVRYWVSAWTKTKSDGEKYQQLRLEVAEAKYQPQQQQAAASVPVQPAAPQPDPDEEIPF